MMQFVLQNNLAGVGSQLTPVINNCPSASVRNAILKQNKAIHKRPIYLEVCFSLN